MPKVSEAHRLAMRERLIDAASRVLARKGYANTTVRDILSEAGVAPGTLYSYFSGKAEILEALTQRSLKHYLARIERLRGTEELSRFFLATIEATLNRSITTASVMSELRATIGDDPEAVAITRRVNELVVEMLLPVIQRVTDSVDGCPLDPEALVELLDIVWDGLVRRAASDTFVTSYERVGRVALHYLLGEIETDVSP